MTPKTKAYLAFCNKVASKEFPLKRMLVDEEYPRWWFSGTHLNGEIHCEKKFSSPRKQQKYS